ncbi:MAG: 4-phosphopantetheinyl transferase family protein [Syntrophaceae bacterium]|nr:4-phosphopantetheinyl transferase family protein [Syntrophaceae bacterium]
MRDGGKIFCRSGTTSWICRIPATGKEPGSPLPQRAFRPSERDRIAGSENPDREMWTLWAAKEAAYKALSKSFPSLSSVPRLFSVSLSSFEPTVPQEGRGHGTVACPRGPVTIRVFRTAEYVHCVASDELDGRLEGMIGQVVRLADAPKRTGFAGRVRLTREAAAREAFRTPGAAERMRWRSGA